MAIRNSACGADEFSPVLVIPASQADAYRQSGSSHERLGDEPVHESRLGASLVDRRWMMNMMVTAVGTVAVCPDMRPPAGATMTSGVDPVLVLIDEHKRSIAEVNRLLDVIDVLEHELPASARQSDWNCLGLTIVPSDDERWKDAQQRYHHEFHHSDEVALEMLSAEPTTFAGVAALLKYATDHIDHGYLWPDNLTSVDDNQGDGQEHRRTWLYFLSRNIAASIERLVA